MASLRISAAGRQLALHNGKGRPLSAVSTFRLGSSISRNYSALSTSRCSAFPQRPQRIGLYASTVSIRFASTAASTAPQPTPTAGAAPASTPTNPLEELVTSFEGLAAPLPDFTPHVGYLKELGLDYGWGPTAMVQWMVEHIQVGADLPMWLAVIGSVVVTRIFLLPIFFQASDTQARMATMGPLVKPIQEEMKVCQANGDRVGMMKARNDLSAVFKKANIRYRDMFMPILCQAPLGYGLFRLTRGMASLPLPELQTTTVAWMTDLTIYDPYFLLPAITSGTIYLTLKAGGEAGEHTGANVSLQKYLRIGVPIISFAFTALLPAMTQIGFFAASIWGAFQAWLLKNKAVRQMLKLHPMPGKKATAQAAAGRAYSGTMTRDTTARVVEPPKPTGLQALKQKYRDTMQSANQMAEKRQKKHSRLTDSELKSATAYEARKRKAAEQDLAEERARERQLRLRRASKTQD